MKATSAAKAAALLTILGPLPLAGAAAVEYLEPNVQRHVGVLPPSVCKQLIALGEKAGFLGEDESIDEKEQKDPTKRYVPAQTIDVYDYCSDHPTDCSDDDIIVGNEAIWDILQPWIPKITQIVKDNRNKEGFSEFYPDDPDREPELNWIFFRKYSPDDERNSLKHHHDTNMNTVNIELSSDYKGGGLFYMKPLTSTGNIDEKYVGAGYGWIDTIKRGNTSDIVFPHLQAGDAVFYNYTVEHGVAPVESGKRYSMAFFFDMDNPDVSDDFEETLADDEFKVVIHNALPGINLDFVQVLDKDGEEVWETVFEDIAFNETADFIAVEGDKILALRAETVDVVSALRLKSEKTVYSISPRNSIQTLGNNNATAEYLEPTVQRHIGVLPKTVCKQLIDLGEKAGFLEEDESIDEDEQNNPDVKYIPAQTINVYQKGSRPDNTDEAEIGDQDIWNLVQGWIPEISQIVKDNRNKEGFSKLYPDDPDREPQLNWIFFRKYSPNEDRNSLQLHHDTNMNTVNIELSEEYEGGGLFYIRPLAATRKIPRKYKNTLTGYEWIDSLKRENTTEIVFPRLHAGDAVFYNYTVEHGVAPVETGARFSMAFFFDMDNPAVKNEFEESANDDVDTDLDADQFEVELQNGLPGMDLDIVQVIEIGDDEVLEQKFENVTYNERTLFVAYEGDRLLAMRAGTGEVVSDIVLKPDQSLYRISQTDPMRSEL